MYYKPVQIDVRVHDRVREVATAMRLSMRDVVERCMGSHLPIMEAEIKAGREQREQEREQTLAKYEEEIQERAKKKKEGFMKFSKFAKRDVPDQEFEEKARREVERDSAEYRRLIGEKQ